MQTQCSTCNQYTCSCPDWQWREQFTGRASSSMCADLAGGEGRKVSPPVTDTDTEIPPPFNPKADSVSGFEGLAPAGTRAEGARGVLVQPESQAITQFSRTPEAQAFLAGFDDCHISHVNSCKPEGQQDHVV